MFLSKDVFEECPGSPGTARQRPATGPPPARPLSASEPRPQTAGGGLWATGDEPEPEILTAASMREKMQRQRQIMLKKQRGMSGLGGMMSVNVVQNDFMPSHPLASTSPAGLNEGRSSAAYTRHGVAGSQIDSSIVPGPARPSVSMPVSRPEAVSSEADVERQKQLAQQLQDVGIMPVFDPVPSARSSGPTSIFDLRQHPGDRRTFLMGPAPKGYTVECKITRDKSAMNSFNPRYVLETEQGEFLMASKKRTMNKTSNYLISMTKTEAPKGSESHLGKLRSNFLGSEFVAYGPGLNPAKLDKDAPLAAMENVREELAAISYTSTLWGKKPRGPRKMEIFLPFVNQRGERIKCKVC
mmetsp:Transcript_12370/g.27560  ORF Transcript_12370/g.27560 Transcript_12370/m.27560 type:complete len:355 (-) Transcript_12370:43-1107(-)